MPRPARIPQNAPDMQELLLRGLPRERALLGRRVALLRLERAWSWYTLASRAGIKSVQVQQIEEGRRDPGFSTLVKLAGALDLRSLDLLLVPAALELSTLAQDPHDHEQ